MQVGLVTGKRQIELVDMPRPEPQPGKAVVDISYCGICGTDLHAYLSGEPYNPAICGHEWVGHVSAKGTAADHVAEGDRVAIGVASACGTCATCRRGDAAHCETAFAGAIGMGPMAAPHGGFAEAIAIDASRLYHVPSSLSDEQAGLLEPATVAVHALRRTPIVLGDQVMIIGAGPIGLFVMQAAHVCGAGSIVVIEPSTARRTIAESLGADVVIDPTADDAQAQIQGAIGANGADVVFECAGIASTIQTAVDNVRRGGVVSLVGVATGAAEIDPAGWLIKEVRLVSSIAYSHEDFDICKHLVVDGRMRTEALHTSTVSLDGMAQAFDQLAENPSEVKILVDPRR